MPFSRPDEPGVTALAQQWQSLAGRDDLSQELIASVFVTISDHYSAKDRAYHKLSHITALLELAASFEDQFQNYDAVRFAIWFHDVIYYPRQADNEEQSAEFAADALSRLSIPAAMIASVREMILATKGHSPAQASADLKLFLDLDLAILGAPEESYRAYSAAIRQEYAWVPEFIYRRERRKILDSFLRREALYQTRPMITKYEAQARRNIADELASL